MAIIVRHSFNAFKTCRLSRIKADYIQQTHSNKGQSQEAAVDKSDYHYHQMLNKERKTNLSLTCSDILKVHV